MKTKNRVLVPGKFFPGRSYWEFAAPLGGKETYDEDEFFQNPEAFKLVLFTGGEDVSPMFYGETSPNNYCFYNLSRDTLEAKVFHTAVEFGVPMFGICRGVQFLNVMLGGRMFHHVNNHGGTSHIATISIDGAPLLVTVNSLHHQMCVPAPDVHVLAYASPKRSDIYIGDKDEPVLYEGPEVEAIYEPTRRVAGVQWHPEMMPTSSMGRQIALCLLRDLLEMDESSFKMKYCTPTEDRSCAKHLWKGLAPSC